MKAAYSIPRKDSRRYNTSTFFGLLLVVYSGRSLSLVPATDHRCSCLQILFSFFFWCVVSFLSAAETKQLSADDEENR